MTKQLRKGFWKILEHGGSPLDYACVFDDNKGWFINLSPSCDFDWLYRDLEGGTPWPYDMDGYPHHLQLPYEFYDHNNTLTENCDHA